MLNVNCAAKKNGGDRASRDCGGQLDRDLVHGVKNT
jgi:hypothetical protein